LSVLLDTHIWVRWLTGAQPLPAREIKTLNRLAAANRLNISAISLWEAQMLFSKGRLPLRISFDRWINQATDPGVVNILPVDTGAVIAMNKLPESFHGDPADRLIVATARFHRLPLATHDSAIRRSRLVKLWKP
jgi:Uncharacterized protein conserved in bacteria